MHKNTCHLVQFSQRPLTLIKVKMVYEFGMSTDESQLALKFENEAGSVKVTSYLAELQFRRKQMQG